MRQDYRLLAGIVIKDITEVLKWLKGSGEKYENLLTDSINNLDKIQADKW